MARRELDEETLKNIADRLPDLEELQKKVKGISPDIISMKIPKDSEIPIAIVCLHDALSTISGARYAVHEFFAHKIWYLEKREVPLEDAANYFCEYYAVDAILRLYSTAEHLANVIIYLLEIKKLQLNEIADKRSSLHIIVGKFLEKNFPDLQITKSILKLAKSNEWKKVCNYGNNWVHNQPPIIKGSGISYIRRKRWILYENGKQILKVGGGDEPEYSIDDLENLILPLLFKFSEVVHLIYDYFIEVLKKYNINMNKDGNLVIKLFK